MYNNSVNFKLKKLAMRQLNKQEEFIFKIKTFDLLLINF